jgi:hypothetical protein
MEKCNLCGRKLTQEELDEYTVYECEDCQNSYGEWYLIRFMYKRLRSDLNALLKW